GRRGALPRGRRHRRRLRSGARARGDVAQDRGAAPRARRRDGPQLRAVLVWLNGRLVDGARAHVSAFDRGLLHGDGAYDTWRTYAGRPFAVPAHVRRLAAAARALALPGPGAAALWERRTRVLVARTRLPDARRRGDGRDDDERLPRGARRARDAAVRRGNPAGRDPRDRAGTRAPRGHDRARRAVDGRPRPARRRALPHRVDDRDRTTRA